MRYIRLFLLTIGSLFFLTFCTKETVDNHWDVSNYKGSFKNITFSESLIKTYSPGIYEEKDIPEDIKHLEYGRIEIDFHYNGGALTSFAPLFYYGSINKNNNDNAVEEPKFHLAIEIGHYNVIPVPVEYLFYTICTYRRPQYCRDTDFPIISGTDYTLIVDKRPEGIILQLRKGNNIVNIFPHAYFPDSTQMFFKDVTTYTEANKGDSLQTVLMVGHGFAGIEKGLHDFNGQISGMRIYKYVISNARVEYELLQVRNQHTENQQVSYSMKDKIYGTDKSIVIKYEFWPYKYQLGQLVPIGEKQTGKSQQIANNEQLVRYQIKSDNIGFYKLYPQTVNDAGTIVGSSEQPFEIWVYPKEWNFEFY